MQVSGRGRLFFQLRLECNEYDATFYLSRYADLFRAGGQTFRRLTYTVTSAPKEDAVTESYSSILGYVRVNIGVFVYRAVVKAQDTPCSSRISSDIYDGIIKIQGQTATEYQVRSTNTKGKSGSI